MGLDITKIDEDYVLVPEKPDVSVVRIPPNVAQEWLTLNTLNRALRSTVAYQADMEARKWAMNGESIKFAWDGTLLDGQHRLTACVDSGEEFISLVVTGLDPAVRATVDGNLMRMVKDHLQMAKMPYSSYAAAIAARLRAYEEEGLLVPPASRDMSISTRVAYALENRDILLAASERAMKVPGSGLRVAPTIIGAAWVICARNVPSEDRLFLAEEFWINQVVGMQGLTATSPALLLRQRLEREYDKEGKPMPPNLAIQYAALAWNYWRGGRTVTRLQAPQGGFRPGTLRFE
jgi:hypothetical protein